jgi:hypothetical protein
VIKSLRESLSLLATRRFGTFWFASLLSSIGTWAQQVAEPWLLLTLGASSFLIGLDTFAMNAPCWPSWFRDWWRGRGFVLPQRIQQAPHPATVSTRRFARRHPSSRDR